MPEPKSVAADGNLKISFVPAIANTAAPLATELNAAGAVDITEYLTGDGFNPDTSEDTIDDARVSTRQNLQRRGRVTETLNIMYVYQPQAAAGAVDNKAFSTLKAGVTGFIVERWGKDYTGNFAAADKVNIRAVECGAQKEQSPAANSVLKIAQQLFITATVNRQAPVT